MPAARGSAATSSSGGSPSGAWPRSTSRGCRACGIEGFEKLVVIKRILPQHALDPELLRMFLDEARLSATLTHPHVTEVYDVGTDGEAPFFAMEYVLGANLRQLMQARAKRDRRGAAAARARHRHRRGGGRGAALRAREARARAASRCTSSIATSRRRTCSCPTTAP